MMQRAQTDLNENSANRQVWLTTFNDMVTLLMVFFVLLFSMSSLDVKRFKNFQNSLQSAMGVLYEGRHAPVGVISDEDLRDMRQADDGRKEPSSESRFEQLDQTQGLEAEYTPKGIKLTLNDNLLFSSGSAQITAGGLVLLAKVSQIIRPMQRNIRIEGHSDNVPISTSRFASNWELSTKRAINVVQYFIQRGGIAPHFLSAVGYGDVKPRVANDRMEQRAKNRRVEIILGRVKRSRPGE